MAGRWTVDVSVARHRLASKPHLTYVEGLPDRVQTRSGGLSATKGILIALCLSALIWAALLLLIL